LYKESVYNDLLVYTATVSADVSSFAVALLARANALLVFAFAFVVATLIVTACVATLIVATTLAKATRFNVRKLSQFICSSAFNVFVTCLFS
jgi:hypothetical protein